VPLLLLPFRDLVGAHLLANVDQNYVTLAVLLVPFYLLATYTGSILHAFNRFAVLNRRTVLASALRLLGTALVVVVLQQGLFGAFLVHVLVGVLAAFWLLPFLVRLTSASIRPDVKLAAATVRFGTKSHLQTLLAALHLRLDHFVVAFFLGPSEVAFYAIATHMAEAMIAVSGPISTVLYPRLASMDDTRMHETTLTVCRHVLVLQVLVGIAIAVLARFAVTTLYGAEYLPAVQPLFILLPGIAMLSLFNVLARNFTSRNKQQTTIVAGLIGLTANVVLNLLLTPRLGIDGTALASTVSYSLAATVLLLFFRVHSGARLTALFTVQRSDVRFYGRLLARLAARPARV
jgi:O-antigen/teichoic acid export membrane protein